MPFRMVPYSSYSGVLTRFQRTVTRWHGASVTEEVGLRPRTVPSAARPAALAGPGRFSVGAIQAVCKDPSMSIANGTMQATWLTVAYGHQTLFVGSVICDPPAAMRQLLVPHHRRSMFGLLAFSVAGSVAWNSLPNYLRVLYVPSIVFVAVWKLRFSFY